MMTSAQVAMVAMTALAAKIAAQPPTPVTAADYAAAARLLEANLTGLVKNQSVEPHWIGGSGDFWYLRDETDGVSYVHFTRKSGAKRPLFDHAALAAALGRALGGAVPSPHGLGLSAVEVTPDLKQLLARVGKKQVRCTLAPMQCTAAEPPPPVDQGALLSPDGRRAVFARNDNLFVRDMASGRETQLTTDGAQYYSYGAMPESMLLTIPKKKFGLVFPPIGVSWSPDGRFLVAARVDERRLPVNPFVEWAPADGSRRPIYHPVRSAFVGDSAQLETEVFAIGVGSGRQAKISLPASAAGDELVIASDPIGWSLRRGQVFVLARTAGSKTLAMVRIDLATGAGSVVVEERATVSRVESNTEEYNLPNARVLDDGATVVWYSARSGAGQLYRYDGQTGALLNSITGTAGAVFNVIAVDSVKREIYFTAGGREPGRDPYYHFLYRASLDRGNPVLLTAPDADHAFPPGRSPLFKLLFRAPDPAPLIHAAAGVFLDTYSTVSTPPVTVLRSTKDGAQLAMIEAADASALFATGWKAPVRERVLAADGVTPIYAVYYVPLRTIGRSKYPVIDAEYGGPQVSVAPRNFPDAYGNGNPLGESGLARLGFAMATIDGRGTPYRDNAFRDAGYPEFTQVGIDDHIAAITQLAERHPEMDLTRVGVYGWSWGGTFAAQAILSRPDFFRVAVSGAGVYDYAALYPGFEGVTGLAVYGNGTRVRGRPDESPAAWAQLDITAMAANLRGHLLLVYGDLDENVPSSQVFRLAAALTRANRPYDLLYLAGRTHGGGGEGYPIKRTWDYFVEHLLGDEPVLDAVVEVKPRGAR